jgi:hypothetical protein
MLDEILSTTKDIVIISPAEAEDKMVFAFPFEGDVARQYFDRTVANAKENKVDGFNKYWKFDEKIGLIKGSSNLLALRLDGEARKDGLWIPTPEQAMFLDEKGKLSNNVYRDYGVVVYSDGNPNKKVAREIIEQTGKELPLVVPFKALVHRIDENFDYGIAVVLSEDPKGIKSRKKAIKLLGDFDFKGNSGACRLDRDWDGNWNAYWDGLGISNANGRVDWMCAEGTRADLMTAYEGLLKRQYSTKIKKLTTERDEKQAEFKKSLE